MDKYFIAYKLSGETLDLVTRAKEYINESFGILVPQKAEPHVTFKAPFTLDGKEDILAHTLLAFAAKQKSFLLNFGGFGHFGTHTIHIDVYPELPNMLLKFQKEFQEVLNDALPEIVFGEYEPYLHLHATVITGDDASLNFSRIWDDVRKKQEFESRFKVDSIALFKKAGSVWNVIHTFKFSQ